MIRRDELFESDVKPKRLKAGDKTTGPSSGLWSFYAADNRARGRIQFGADLFYLNPMAIGGHVELADNAGWCFIFHSVHT